MNDKCTHTCMMLVLLEGRACLNLFLQKSLLVGLELNFWKRGVSRIIRGNLHTIFRENISYKSFICSRMASSNTPSSSRKLFQKEKNACIELVSTKRSIENATPLSQMKVKATALDGV